MNWISVKEELPEKDCVCIIWNEKRPYILRISIYTSLYKEFMDSECFKTLEFPLEVTHYIPMPDTPLKKRKK